MYRTIQRLIVSLLIVLFAAGMISCARDDDPFADLDRELSSGSRSRETLHLYFPGEASPHVTELFDEIEKQSRRDLNLELEVTFLPFGEYLESLPELLEGGGEIDAFLYFPDMMFNGVAIGDLISQGLVAPLGDLLQQHMPAYTSVIEGELRHALARRGDVYLITGYLPYAPKLTVMVREDFVNRFDITGIRNWSELEALLANIAEADSDVFPLALSANPTALFAASSGYNILDTGMLLVYRADDPEMRITAWENTDEYEMGIRRIMDWMDRGFLDRRSIGLDPYMIINSGRWAVITTQRGNDLFLSSYISSEGSEWNYVSFTLFPDQRAQRIDNLDLGIAVSSSSEHPERVLQFIDWFHRSQEHYDLLMYGIEGKHYRLDGERVIPDAELPEGALAFAGKDSFLNIALERDSEDMEAGSIETYRSFIADNSYFPPHFSMVFDFSGVMDNFRARFFAFDNSPMSKIRTGVFSEKDIQEYRDFMESRGTRRMLSLIQEQIDMQLPADADRGAN